MRQRLEPSQLLRLATRPAALLAMLLLGLAGCATAGSAAGVYPEPAELAPGAVVPGQPGAAAGELAAAPLTAMSLGVGDVFEVQVFQDKDLSSTFMVGNDGSINFPLVGKLQVRGMTPNQVADLVRARLQEGYIRDPIVSVLLKSSNSKKVFVFGQVRSPGAFSFEDEMSVVQAITQAGGFTVLAAKDGTNVTRQESGIERKYTVPITKILDGERRNFLLRPGDIIFVPESMF